jgi:hypothetical protein
MNRPLLMYVGLIGMAVGLNHAQAQAPKKSTTDPQRNVQWKPQQGKYYFSHALVYEYLVKADSTRGEFRVYIDPATGTMCFERESSFGMTDEMTDAILALPTGQFIACGTNEDGKKVRIAYENSAVKPHPDDVAFQQENFKTQCRPTGQIRQENGLESTEYVLSLTRTAEKAQIWLAPVPFNVYPFYGFDEWGGDAQLPVSLSYNYILPPRLLITEMDDPYTYLKLISYTNSPYSLDLNQYARSKEQ